LAAFRAHPANGRFHALPGAAMTCLRSILGSVAPPESVLRIKKYGQPSKDWHPPMLRPNYFTWVKGEGAVLKIVQFVPII
jgi:hypothetical protein